MTFRLRSFASVVLGSGALLLAACSGGSSGGVDDPDSDSSFFLVGASYGRAVEEAGVTRIVSPYTTVETDPITGTAIPGTLETLSSGIDIDRLVTFGLSANYVPRVLPRNGVIVLRFPTAVDPDSVIADVLDADGNVVTPGTVRIRRQDGRGVPVDLIVNGNQVWIDPLVEGNVGFPASPVDFGPDGEPRADATGFLRVIVPAATLPLDPAAAPPRVVRSLAGAYNVARPDDGLGLGNNPIGFNPGNEVLDFLSQDQIVATNETFNGFLPDVTAPRIVREHTRSGTIDFGAGDIVGAGSITKAGAGFNVSANNGAGEWANKQLTIRPGENDQEIFTVTSNTADTLMLAANFGTPPADGDSFVLSRAEFFEPDPDAPINQDIFDPNNPQNDANSRLVNFVQAWEIDASANRIGEMLSLRDTLPAFSEITVRFNEPMDVQSLKQWETFRVARNPDPGPNSELVTRLVVNARQDQVSIQPVRVDQTDDSFEVLGWGPNVQNLQFLVRTVPSVSFLQERMSSQAVENFVNQGIRGIKDLGGRALAFPTTFFDPANPAITFPEPFFTDESLSTFDPPPASDNWSMMVHRFLGRPTTGTDEATGLPGVAFGDQENMYTPIADVNLAVNGRLAGQPVVFITKVHDDFYPPPDGQFGAFPLGTLTPLMHYLAGETGPPPYAHQGARMQQVFRDVDASPGRDGLAGTLLDLYRISWAPIGGNVTADSYEDISLHTAHSHFRPITNQNGAGAVDPNFGLNEMFDWITFEDHYLRNIKVCEPPSMPPEGPNYLPYSYVTNVAPGTGWKISPQKLFSPPFDNNAFHPWPEFQQVFQYNNGDVPNEEKQLQRDFNNSSDAAGNGKPWRDKRRNEGGVDNRGGDSLMLEVRIRPQEAGISAQNGFTFSPGILIARFPFFRAFSRGEAGDPMFPDDIVNDPRAKCATPFVGGRATDWGDNSRYFAVFDYVKTTSRVTSPYVRIFPGNGENARYSNAFFEPRLDQAPAGTQVVVEFEGANNAKGGGGSGFSTDIRFANTKTNLAFRVTLVGNTVTLLSPNFDTVAIPFQLDR